MDRQFDSKQVVTAIYRFLVDRDPDEGGMADFVAFLNSGDSIEEVMRRAAQSEEFKSQLYRFLCSLA